MAPLFTGFRFGFGRGAAGGAEAWDGGIQATGGTTTSYSAPQSRTYKVHSFLSDGTFTVTNTSGNTPTYPDSMSVLCVGAGGRGGGGGDGSGGGGGGGMCAVPAIDCASAGSYAVDVGTSSGEPSSIEVGGQPFTALIGYGGGAGGTGGQDGQPGGSGGGGGGDDGNQPAGTGNRITGTTTTCPDFEGLMTPYTSQGNSGGPGRGTVGRSTNAGGSGGGAGSGGRAGSDNPGRSYAGGPGRGNDFRTGSTVTYAGGGSGWAHPGSNPRGAPDAPGGGGGTVPPTADSNGEANTGGGGAGGTGGEGGSGIVIVRYLVPPSQPI